MKKKSEQPKKVRWKRRKNERERDREKDETKHEIEVAKKGDKQTSPPAKPNERRTKRN